MTGEAFVFVLQKTFISRCMQVLFMNGLFRMYVLGVEIPEWFTYKNSGTGSISVALPKNWFTPTFRGFAVCAVFDMINPFILRKFKWDGPMNFHTDKFLRNSQGPEVWFKFTSHDGLRRESWFSFSSIGSENCWFR